MASKIADNAARVRDVIARAAARVGRDPREITLIAVSKTRPAEDVVEAYHAGLGDFGENRVQEAVEKIPRVRELLGDEPTWHMIGTLQRNKIRDALGCFAMIQSVDSLRLAEAISARAEGRRVPILLEVYLGDDAARPGFRPSELHTDVPSLLGLPNIAVRGLMTVAPRGLSREDTRRVFRQLRGLRDRLASEYPDGDWRELSMGMTDDYPLAIEEGATIVRVGRAIFGERC